jgi:hypothetical protein
MMGAAVRAASAPVPVVPSQNGQPDLALNRVSPKSLGGPGSADIASRPDHRPTTSAGRCNSRTSLVMPPGTK